jgi:Uma2 family endonuclease
MTAIARLPVSEKMLESLLKEQAFVQIPATEAEFWQLIELPQYHLAFHNQHITATMSYGTTNHERVVRNLVSFFDNDLDIDTYETFGSNRPVYSEECSIFQPDVHVVEGKLEEYKYEKTKTATANAAVIVEVFSPSTKGFDLTEKLTCYKTIPSLKHIIYIEQSKIHVQVYTRTRRPNEWQNVDYFDLNDKIKVLGKSISLKKIYQKVVFSED